LLTPALPFNFVVTVDKKKSTIHRGRCSQRQGTPLTSQHRPCHHHLILIPLPFIDRCQYSNSSNKKKNNVLDEPEFLLCRGQ
jgi:hypothetical protein